MTILPRGAFRMKPLRRPTSNERLVCAEGFTKTSAEREDDYIWPWADKEEGDAKKPTWKIQPLLHRIWVEADNSFTASVGRAALLHIFRTILLPEMPFYAYGYQVLPQHETRHKI